MNKKDAVCILFLIFVAATLILFRLGSAQTPETGLYMVSEECHNEIFFHFDQEYEFRNMYVFLGNISKRNINIYYVNYEKEGWQKWNQEVNVESVFAWNTIDLPVKAYAICIVGTDKELAFNEIVFAGKDGYIKIPVNTEEYPELFDEQSKIPGRMTYYYNTMFDEVYYARTAYEMIHGIDIYEWTHPPLGKILMTIGLRVFGTTPLGWRIVSAVFGIMMVPLFYLFALELTGKSQIALTAGILLCTEFMHETLSRICTIDIIVAFFVILMYFFMVRFVKIFRSEGSFQKQSVLLLLCGLSMGFAIATKWTGIYGAVGLAIIFFAELIPWESRLGWNRETRKMLLKYMVVCIFSFILLPMLIYTLSYIPFLKTETGGRGLLRIVIDNAVAMLKYHGNAKSQHPYSSEWYSWLIDWRPLLDSLTSMGQNRFSIVATFGNPIIMYSGLFALIYNIFCGLIKHDVCARALSIGYLCMLLPWVGITRTVFIYQYFICILFLIFHLVYAISKMQKRQDMTLMVLTALSGIVFILYYPVLTGSIELDADYVNTILEVLPMWGFC